VRRLADLSAKELAQLLNLSVGEARKWLEHTNLFPELPSLLALFIEDVEPLLESDDPEALEEAQRWWKQTMTIFSRESHHSSEPYTSEEERRLLWQAAITSILRLPVETVQRLLASGVFYALYHPFLRYLQFPRDAGGRWRQLRFLLLEEVEFETRYPVAYKVLYAERARKEEPLGLSLPSFNVRVLRHAPKSYFRLPGELWESGDAYSSMYGLRDPGDSSIKQNFLSLDIGYLRGILLAILSREEYQERITREADRDRDNATRRGLLEGLGVPTESSVRLTDLRLAVDLKSNLRARNLKQALSLLQKPITVDHVLQWKQLVLEQPAELVKQGFKDQETGVASVSFAAAALLLFLDFKMPQVQDATSYRLAEQVESLAAVIKTLAEALDGAASDLEKVLANRGAGVHRERGLESKFYNALDMYRMGKGLEDIASHLGITPYSSKAGRGTRPWKQRVTQAIHRGVEVERKRYPLAARIFANKDKRRVQRKARLAYATYISPTYVSRPYGIRIPNSYPLQIAGDEIGINASHERGLEVTRAYIQLGSCLILDIPPTP
jgi:hypothetical protein